MGNSPYGLIPRWVILYMGSYLYESGKLKPLMPIRFKLSEVAQKADMSIRRLSIDSGVDYKTLHLLKTGKQKGLSFSVLERICQTLKCDPGELFEIVRNRPKHSTSARVTARSWKSARRGTS